MTKGGRDGVPTWGEEVKGMKEAKLLLGFEFALHGLELGG